MGRLQRRSPRATSPPAAADVVPVTHEPVDVLRQRPSDSGPAEREFTFAFAGDVNFAKRTATGWPKTRPRRSGSLPVC